MPVIKNMTAIQKDQRKVFYSWCLYDWANSSYSLVITSAIFPAYFLAIAHTKQNILQIVLIINYLQFIFNFFPKLMINDRVRTIEYNQLKKFFVAI
jgi:MFS-type transporter involved in bile tolerance (Atg22 family)